MSPTTQTDAPAQLAATIEIAAISNRLVGVAMGGIPTFTGELRDGMRQTLERIKADAER